MVRICGVDQLSRDSQPVAGLSNAALEYRLDTELPADRTCVDLLTFERERGGAGSHPEVGNLGQCVDEVFRQPIAEVLVFRIGTHVCERQHRD